jgi:putative ABC transport system permease protein
VTAAGAATNVPLVGGGTNTFRAEGLPEPAAAERPDALMRGVAGRYFEALGIRIAANRSFTRTDDSTAPPVIMVSAELARQIFGSVEAAIGRRLRFYAFPEDAFEIVGVTGDVMTGRLDEAPPRTIYYPHLQIAENRMTVVVRAEGPPEPLARLAQAQVRELDPALPVYQLRTMDQAVQDSPAVFARRYPLLLLSAFAFIALLLSLIGVYGVVAYSVSRRTRELGIRMALGATVSSILRLVMREGTLLALAGVASGLALSGLLGRSLSAVLYGVRPMDIVTHGAVSAGLAAAALIATLLPARRAARVDPAITLRME